MMETDPSPPKPPQAGITSSSENHSAPKSTELDITTTSNALAEISGQFSSATHLENGKNLKAEKEHIAIFPDEKFAQAKVPHDPIKQSHSVKAGAVIEERDCLDAALNGLPRSPDINHWFYTPSWKRLPTLSPQSLNLKQHWLLLLDDQGLGQTLVEQLTAAGQQVTTVICGEHGPRQKADQADYFIDPKGGFAALFQSLKGPFPNHILHLCSLSADLDLRADRAAAQTERYFPLLLSLVQAIDRNGQAHPVQLSVVSNGAYSLLGTEALNPFKSLLVSVIKSISADNSQIICRYLDLEEVLPEALSRSQWVQMLLTELVDPEPPLEVAYRGRSRWIPIYEPTPLPEPVNHLRLRPRGVYLITDGLAGMGLTLARYLAQAFQAKLVLPSRSALPERSSWTSWCATHPDTDAIRRKIQQVQELEACGATVWLGQVKLTDAAAVQSLVNAAEAELGAIQGIIHGSVLEGFGGKLQDQSQSKTDPILPTLVEHITGTLVLDQIFRDRPLDFWAMCSSLSTVLFKTSSSHADYSAVNEFWGAFCQYKQQTSQTFSVAIHWPECEGVGTTEESPIRRSAQKDCEEANDLIAVTLAEGAEAFARILCQFQAQVMVTPQDLNLLLHLQSERKGEPQSQTGQNSELLSLSLLPLQSQRIQQSTNLQSLKLPEQSIPPAMDLVDQLNERSEKIAFQISRQAESDSTNGSSKYKSSSFEFSNVEHLPSELQQPRPSTLFQPRLAELQPGCLDHPPLFFVHPASGSVSDYTILGRHLNPNWPFFALQATGLESETSPLHNLTQMATRYIETLRSRQPTGPYYLGGWSMGGVVAYEMSLQLLQAGESVSGLVLIDSPAPVAMARDVVTDFNVFAKGLGFFLEQVKELSQSLRFRPSAIEVPLQRLLEEGLRLNTLPQHFTLEQLHRLYTVFDAHSRALSTYTAMPCSKRLPSLFLQAQVADNPQFSQLGSQAAVRWSKLLGRSLLGRTLPGDHYSLMVEPQVTVLSTYINGFLQQVRPTVQRASGSTV